jgi:hypothetical protein
MRMPSQSSYALRLRNIAKMTAVTLLLSGLFYLPPYLTNGSSFFDFHKPPYPAIAEALYKMSIGVWGLLGCLALLAATFLIFMRKQVKQTIFTETWLLVVLVFGAAYLRMPEKAAFWLPVVPFVILWFAGSLHKKERLAIALLMIASGWFFGINTTDKHTGIKSGISSIKMHIAGEALVFDLLRGPILHDYEKRTVKAEACKTIQQNLSALNEPTFVVAGWWYAMLEVNRLDGKWKNNYVALGYLTPPAEQRAYKNRGYTLRYLPKQADIVDRKYNTDYTRKNATELPIQ